MIKKKKLLWTPYLFRHPGAFLHAHVDKDSTMVLKGRLTELMVQVAPNL